jgi:hypothetical protein
MPDVNSIPFRQADPNGHYRSKQLPQDKGDFLEGLGLPEFAGDVVSASTAGTTGGEVATFWGTDGHTIKADNHTGIAKLTTGVLSTVPAPTGAIVGTTDVQTLTNKRLEGADLFGTTGLTKTDVGLSNVDNTSDASKPISSATQSALNGKEDKTNKGVINGYSSLDGSGKVPMSEIPDAIIGASRYQGTWNAATNSPTIPAAAPANQGYYYSVAVGGSTNIDGISSWAVGDTIISNGSIWQKIPVANAVQSVNGKTGIVVVNKSDVVLGNVDNTSDSTKFSMAATLTNKIIDGANNTLNVRLNTTDVSGSLPVSKLNAGTNASAITFWRGDGQWVSPTGAGDVTGPTSAADGDVTVFDGTTGKTIKTSGVQVTSLATGPATSVDGDLVKFSGASGKVLADLTRTGLTSDYLCGTNAYRDLAAAVRPTIWSVRTRSFNSVGNANFEVDQRRCGQVTNPGTTGFLMDRWALFITGTMRVSGQQMAVNVPVPGTNFYVTSKILRTTLTTVQGSLGAGDYAILYQEIEGTEMRELLGDVHSVSLLVRSSVANLKFSVALKDTAGTPTRSLVKLCSLGAADTWTLVQLPNIPVWDAGGTWGAGPGVLGYTLNICLAAGSTFTAPAADVWQTGNYVGASGMSNFAANAVNSTFDVAFVQHEPGNECTAFIDVPWTENYEKCLRYYQKTWDYAALPGSINVVGFWVVNVTPAAGAIGPFQFTKALAKVPGLQPYSPPTAAVGAVRDLNAGVDRGVSSPQQSTGLNRFGGWTLSSTNAAATYYGLHCTIDTGW